MGLFSSTKKSTVTYDPKLMTDAYGNFDAAKALGSGYKPYDGQMTADPTQGLSDYWKSGTDFAQGTAGDGYLKQAGDALTGSLGYQASHVAPTAMTSATAGPAAQVDATGILKGLTPTSADVSTAGMADRGAIRNVQVGDFTSTLPKFLNPATDQIVTAGQADIEHQRQVQQAHDAAKFSSGSWGGSRQGVNDAVTNDNFQRASATEAANLRGSAYDKAQSGALQYLGLDLSGQQSNQGADQFVVGQNADTARSNAALKTANSQFNAGQGNQMATTGAGILRDVGLANVGAQNEFAQNQAGRDQAASTTNTNNDLAASIANAQGDNTAAGLRLTGANDIAGLANDQVSQQIAKLGVLQGVGNSQQDQAQLADNNQYKLYTDNFGNQVTLQYLITQALGAIPKGSTTTGTEDPSLLSKIGSTISTGTSIAKLFGG